MHGRNFGPKSAGDIAGAGTTCHWPTASAISADCLRYYDVYPNTHAPNFKDYKALCLRILLLIC